MTTTRMILCFLIALIMCGSTVAEENPGDALGKALGGFVEGLFGGGANRTKSDVQKQPQNLQPKTMNDVSPEKIAWLKQQKFKKFCGIKLGEEENSTWGISWRIFLRAVAGDITARYGGYYYDNQLNAIVYEGDAGSFSEGAGRFRNGHHRDYEITVIITPISHKVAAISAKGYSEFCYDLNGIGEVLNQRAIKSALYESIGRDFFVESGGLDIGNGTQTIYFSTTEYQVDKRKTSKVKRNFCTSVFVGDNATWKLLASEGMEFVRRINKQAEEDKLSVVRQVCGVAFGSLISKNAQMEYMSREGVSILRGRFWLNNPMTINGEVVKTMLIYTSIKSRRIYAVELEIANDRTRNAIVELMLKKYKWRMAPFPPSLFCRSRSDVHRCGDVIMEDFGARFYHLPSIGIAENESKVFEQEKNDAANRKEQQELSDAFNKL